ncbi:SDR family oxidoreductase [Yinghuangia sp. ASG 101]|uniref:SDR family oxidoreductase n=1 Tax=Yinghuangia sp. ASG 101 TaxID=2896848 RepID=UPI001E59D9E7|nr:SDR family oxidoreductase [Yinghuangia sp. ASG 101]UGQ11627.1 SDR family oxidoreductase [Yinghuangia sp. ASG 101]
MIVVTGATGRLGRRTVETLLARGVRADGIAVAVRTPERAADLARQGVQVREGDYDRPDTLPAAFADADKLLLVSANAHDDTLRIAQHRNAIAAAHAAGVGHLAYTSIVDADTNPLALATVHKATEEAVRASGLPFTLLRNGWYFENYTAGIPAAVERGGIVGTAADGRVAAASIADYAEAAAVVLTGTGHEGKAYELTGDASWTLADLAAEIARQSGTDVTYTDVPAGQLAEILAGAGLPQGLVPLLVDAEVHTRGGALGRVTDDLRTLIGRPSATLAEAVAAALKN